MAKRKKTLADCVWRTRKSCGNTCLLAGVPTTFLVLPNSCFYNLIEIRNVFYCSSATFHFSPQVFTATFKNSPIVDVIADCSMKPARHHVTVVIFQHSPQGYNTPLTTLLDEHLETTQLYFNQSEWLSPPTVGNWVFMISVIFNLTNWRQLFMRLSC